jgi:hypothetical protein
MFLPYEVQTRYKAAAAAAAAASKELDGATVVDSCHSHVRQR